MSFEEKHSWAYLLTAIGGYAIYVTVLLSQAAGAPLEEAPYASTMLWLIGGTIVASIILTIVLGMFSPSDAGKKDQRDKDINRLGEYVAGLVLGIGFVVPFLLTLAEVDHFWIANAIYLVFVLAAVIGTTVKVVAYRRGL